MSELDEFRGREPNLELAKKLKRFAWCFTLLMFLVLGMMERVNIPLPEGVSLTMLPAVNAGINSTVAVLLVLALVAIKRGHAAIHRRLIHAAMGFSALFLVSYLAYHFTSKETIFGDLNHDGTLDLAERAAAGRMRTVYLVVLLTHIVLAAVTLPFILMTWVNGFTNQFDRHRRLARLVFPAWLLVAVSGPVCYLLLRPYY